MTFCILHSTFYMRSRVACISIRNSENGRLRARGTLVAVWYHHGPAMVPQNGSPPVQDGPPGAPNSRSRPLATSTPLMANRLRFQGTQGRGDADSQNCPGVWRFRIGQPAGLPEGRRSPGVFGAATSGEWHRRRPAPRQRVPDWFLGVGARPRV